MRTLQKLSVKGAFRSEEEDLAPVRLADTIHVVIDNFVHHAEFGGVFVIGDDQRFSGVITRTDLLDWVRVKLGAAFLKPLPDVDKTLRLASLVNAQTVVDLLRPETKNAAVSVNDSLAHALKLMIEADLIILPVVDDAWRIIGRLTLSELLNRALAEGE